MPPLRKTVVCLVLLGAALGWPWPSSRGRVEAQGGVAIEVDAAADRHPIDPRVYGVNWASASELQALNVPVNRWGGNPTSRYNWKLNADNRGADWYFESIAYAAVEGGEADAFISDTFGGGADPMVTIPLTGWVAKVGTGRNKLSSFSAAKYGAQQDCDWSWFPDACNGVRTSGAYVTGNDPNDANAPSTPQLQKEWVQHLVAKWGGAASGGVPYYIYDNEPGLWFATHRDVRPVGVKMDELRDAIVAYGTALRQADPDAFLVGPELWGWSGYFYSGYDLQTMNASGCWTCTPDRDAHGGADLLPWLLDQLRQHEQATGTRLLDVLTVHYYPQGGEFGSDTSASMQARRNRSTRSLWDPTYVDETWISDTVRLIPRMKQWVDAHYPGLEIGLTEYNWGAEGHINGATTQADVLGIFGREGLDIATFWAAPDPRTPLFRAFQMYRNYDGAWSTFGDVSVRATAPDPDTVSAFAAERTSDGALTVMAINKATTSNLVTLSLSGFTPGGSAQVWRLASSNVIQQIADVAVVGGTINATLPGQSITLFVVPASGSTPLPPSLSIGDVSLSEGDSGATSATFPLTLSSASTEPVTVQYATADGTASAGSDYTAVAGNITFDAGQTSRSVTVSVIGDTTVEPDETFFVSLSSPSGATLANSRGRGVITNDDSAQANSVVSVGDVVVAEGDRRTTLARFVVTLSAPSPQRVTVSYSTADGSATAGSDYVARAGRVAFRPGQTQQAISVKVVGDRTVEPDEVFFVSLSAPKNATLGDALGQATIVNDDGS